MTAPTMLKPSFAVFWVFLCWGAAHAQPGCNLTPVHLGNDTILCPGQTLLLNAGTYPTYLWDNGTTAATRSVATSGAYSVRVSGLGTNQIVNGDFELGNTGFTTSYTVGTGGAWGLLSNPGTYAISTSPSVTHSNFNVCNDHTPAPGQNQMVVNGAMVPNTQVWCQSIGVAPATDYQFGTWVASALTDPAVAQLQFSINSVQLGAIFSPSSTGCTWQQFTQTWNSGISTTALICIVNQNTNGGGNDFALDDITFRPVCYAFDTIDVLFTAPTVNAGPDVLVCANATDTLSVVAQAGASYQWTPAAAVVSGDTTPHLVVGNLSPAAVQSTTYTLTLTDSVGCTGTDQVTVTFNPPVTGPFAGTDAQLCAHDTAQLGIAALPGYTYQWSPAAGLIGAPTGPQVKVTHSDTSTIAVQRTYVVSVHDGNNCPGVDSVTVLFKPIRLAEFSVPDSLCVGEAGAAQFTGADPAGVGFAWNFNGGAAANTNTAGPLLVSWTTPGTKTIHLTTTLQGCTHDSSLQTVVSSIPTADFSLDNDVCIGEAAALNYTGTGSATAQLAWDFSGGSNTGTLRAPLLAWGTAGPRTITLVVSENGCTSPSVSHSVEVHPLPVAAFTFQHACENSPISFVSTATVAGNDVIQTTLWDFGTTPPATSVSPTPVYAYAATGTYNVHLIATSSAGCTDDTTRTVLVYPNPKADFRWQDNCANDTTQFTDLSTVAGLGAAITQWQWSFGNGIFSAQPSPSHPYQFNGGDNTYVVRLTLKTNQACTDTVYKAVTINPVPQVSFSQTDVCLHDPTVFTDLSRIAQPGGGLGRNGLAQWHWTFGDSLNGSSAAADPQYTYAAAGSYTAHLTVISDSGCVGSFSREGQVFPPPPDPVVVHDTVCLGEAASLRAEAPVGIGTRWFADAFAPDVLASGRTFRTPPVTEVQVYYVQTLTAEGCTSDRTPVQASVWPDAGAVLTASANVVDMPDSDIRFTVSATRPMAYYQWDFGDGTTSTDSAPSHTYGWPGYFTVYVKLWDTSGCPAELATLIEVARLVNVTVPTVFTPNGDSRNDEFFAPSFNLSSLHIQLFDRWGHAVFESQEIGFRWDGKDPHGNLLPEGVYLYVIEATSFDGFQAIKKGAVTLVR